ncbi:MAG TPA: hypothetical protein VJI46_01695 [Candidatus Nanoarchaeia archaeon]|nr:hypothetical protein [Candidatus Nanoarchaeia archaeon]
MQEPKKILAEWFVQFAKNRDLIHRKIESIDENENVIHYKDKDLNILIGPFLGDVGEIIRQMEKGKHYAVVVFNTKDNFKKIFENWKSLAEFRFLTIYFVNPLSQKDKKWIVMPHTHSRITEEKSLKRGLMSMFEMVDEFSREDAARLE